MLCKSDESCINKYEQWRIRQETALANDYTSLLTAALSAIIGVNCNDKDISEPKCSLQDLNIETLQKNIDEKVAAIKESLDRKPTPPEPVDIFNLDETFEVPPKEAKEAKEALPADSDIISEQLEIADTIQQESNKELENNKSYIEDFQQSLTSEPSTQDIEMLRANVQETAAQLSSLQTNLETNKNRIIELEQQFVDKLRENALNEQQVQANILEKEQEFIKKEQELNKAKIEINELAQKIIDLKSNQTLENEPLLQTLEAQKKQVEQSVNLLAETIEADNIAFSKLKEQHLNVEEQNSSLKKEKVETDKLIVELQATQSQLVNQMQDIQTTKETVEQQLIQSEQKLKTMASKLDETEKWLSETTKNYNSHINKISEMEELFTNALNENGLKEKQLQADIAEKQQEMVRKERELEEAKTKINDFAKRILDLQEGNKTSETEPLLKALEAQKIQVEYSVNLLADTIDADNIAFSNLNEQKKQLEEQNSRLTREKEEKDKLINDYQTNEKQLEQRISSLQQTKLKVEKQLAQSIATTTGAAATIGTKDTTTTAATAATAATTTDAATVTKDITTTDATTSDATTSDATKNVQVKSIANVQTSTLIKPMDDGSNEIIIKILVPPNSQTSIIGKDGDSTETTLSKLALYGGKHKKTKSNKYSKKSQRKTRRQKLGKIVI